MEIEIHSNPNCLPLDLMVFDTIDAPQKILGLKDRWFEEDELFDVVGVYEGGTFGPCFAQKINDSGEGIAYLIYGGPWGIRMKPHAQNSESWDLKNSHQRGYSHRIYGHISDIRFAIS